MSQPSSGHFDCSGYPCNIPFAAVASEPGQSLPVNAREAAHCESELCGQERGPARARVFRQAASGCDEGTRRRVTETSFQAWLCPFLAVWPWAD